MAEEKMIFPVGFDLDSGVKQAEKDWKNTYHKKLQKAIDQTPLKVKLKIDAKSLDLGSLRDYNKLTKEAALAAKRAADVESKRALARQRQSAARVAEATEEARIAKAKAQSEMAQLRLNDAQKNGFRHASQLNGAYAKQSTYLSRLVQRMGLYFGIHQFASLLRNVRETTAQFELQEVALGAIIQDAHAASVLFSQIKAAAVESPYQIKELVNYTKQLAAYGFEQETLFNTTMRLADISAGLGADMSRLILAVGQISAATVLKGTELRQLTELGLPMVELLAEKLTELRGEVVSTSDVFDLISDKAISFGLVEEVLNDLTDAGGMFYNMQQKQAETLAGQWSNLKDTIAIAYDEIGNTEKVRGAMEGFISLTKGLAANWNSVTNAMIGLAVTVGVVKTLNGVLALYTAKTNTATAATAGYVAALRQMSVARKGGFFVEMLATQSLWAATAMKKAAVSTNLFAKSLWKMVAVLARNWIALAVVAVTALTVAIVNARQKANELNKELSKIGTEGAIKMEQSARNFKRLAEIAVNSVDGTKEQSDALKELQRSYGDLIPAQDLQIEKLRALKGNYDSLTNSIREKVAMQTLEQEIGAIQEHYGSDISDARKEYQDHLQKSGLSREEAIRVIANLQRQAKDNAILASRELSKGAKKYTDAVESALKQALSEEVGEDFAKSISASYIDPRGVEMLFPSLREFMDLTRQMNGEIDDVTDTMKASTGVLGKYTEAWDSATEQIKKDVGNITVSRNTKLYEENVEKAKVKNYADFLKTIISSEFANFDINKYVSNGVIDFEALFKIDGLSVQAKNAITKVMEELKGLDSWRETIQSFSTDLNLSGLSRKIALYTDEEIKNFGNLKSALTDVQKKYKEYTATVAFYSRVLKTSLTAAEKQHAQDQLDIATELQRQAKEVLNYFNTALTTKTVGTSSDPWLNNWQNRLSLMKDFQRGVEALSKKMSELDAIARERDIMRFRGTVSGINVDTLTGSPEELSKWYDSAIKEVQKKINTFKGFKGLDIGQILMKSTSNKKLKSYIELLQKLLNEKTDFETTQLEKDLKKEIDRLATAVAQSKEAKDFFDKMLGITGDRQLSADLTVSVYGGIGDDLKDNIRNQLTQAFEGVDISEAIGGKEIDYKSLKALIETLPEEKRANARKIVDSAIKSNAEIIQDLYKTLVKFEDYESKRVNILRKGIEERRRIEEANLTRTEKDRLISASKTAESKALANLEYEDFKGGDMYITMFENLDYVTSDTLRNMRQKLLDLKTVLGESLDPAQLKEIVTKMEDIDAALSRKNPFKTLSQFIKKYKEDYTKVERKNLEKNLLQANEDRDKAKEDADAKADAVLAQEEMVRLAEQEYGIDSESAHMQREMLVDAKNDLEIAKDNLHQKEKVLENLNDQARAWRGIKNATKEAIHGEDGIVDWINSAQSMLDSIKNLTESFGVGGTASEWIGSVSSLLGGAGGTAAGIGQLMSGNIAEGLANTLNGLAEIAIGIFDASYIERVDAANREIEKQEKALSDLSFAYDTLQKEMDSALGSDYISNYSQILSNLQAQQEAYEKQAQAERDKGKKADEEAIRQYEDAARESAQKIADKEKELSRHFLGTDVASAARDFAVAWMDAYENFESTSDAIKQKFADMVQNMIVESLASKVIQGQMEDIFDMVESLSKDGQLSVSDAAHIAQMSKVASENIDVGMTNLMNALESAGISVRGMGTDLTGISKDLATASEESILGLAAGINTQNFYISQVPPKLDTIIAILQGGATPVAGVNVQDLITIQNQHLASLPNIATNTLNTADRCERAAIACESALSKISSVISLRGTASSHVVNTN